MDLETCLDIHGDLPLRANTALCWAEALSVPRTNEWIRKFFATPYWLVWQIYLKIQWLPNAIFTEKRDAWFIDSRTADVFRLWRWAIFSLGH